MKANHIRKCSNMDCYHSEWILHYNNSFQAWGARSVIIVFKVHSSNSTMPINFSFVNAHIFVVQIAYVRGLSYLFESCDSIRMQSNLPFKHFD